jgi:hypothetical protein
LIDPGRLSGKHENCSLARISLGMKDEQLMTSQDKVRALLVSAVMQEEHSTACGAALKRSTLLRKTKPKSLRSTGSKRLPSHCKTITINEVGVVIELFGRDDCYDFAASFMHLIRATPGSPLKDCLEQLNDEWKIGQRDRAIRRAAV